MSERLVSFGMPSASLDIARDISRVHSTVAPEMLDRIGLPKEVRAEIFAFLCRTFLVLLFIFLAFGLPLYLAIRYI